MKNILFLRDTKDFSKGDSFNVKVLQYGLVGGFDRFPNDCMEGGLEWSILCEFENGNVNHFVIGYDVEIRKYEL